jgi:hypothetical protein
MISEMSMKRNIIPMFLMIVVTVAMTMKAEAQKIALYQSKWNPELAANNEEDLLNRMQFDDKSKFMFLLSNDEEFLYINLVLSDQAAIQKIMRYGLTTWLNSEGKTKKGTGIGFPLAPDEFGEPAFRKEKGGDRKAMMNAMMDNKNKQMELIGFEEKGIVTVIDPRLDPAFDGTIRMIEGGKIHVNIVLPLEKIGRGKVTSDFSPVAIGFETGYMDVTGQGGGSGGGMQGGGGMPGGGMHGGMPGGGPPQGANPTGDQQAGNTQQPEISKLASPSKLWIKQLALTEKQ